MALTMSTLLIVMFCVSEYEPPTVFQKRFNINILDGGFVFPGSPPDGWTASESLTAVANEEVTLNFTSGDFVYTVLQYEHEVAKVILPGKSACGVSVQLLPGVWEFKLAAGCGGRSPGHKKILYIEAVDRP